MTTGLKGSGCDYELEIIDQSEKAFKVETIEGDIVWMPKSAFDETGELKDWAYAMLDEKINRSNT